MSPSLFKGKLLFLLLIFFALAVGCSRYRLSITLERSLPQEELSAMRCEKKPQEPGPAETTSQKERKSLTLAVTQAERQYLELYLNWRRSHEWVVSKLQKRLRTASFVRSEILLVKQNLLCLEPFIEREKRGKLKELADLYSQAAERYVIGRNDYTVRFLEKIARAVKKEFSPF